MWRGRSTIPPLIYKPKKGIFLSPILPGSGWILGHGMDQPSFDARLEATTPPISDIEVDRKVDPPLDRFSNPIFPNQIPTQNDPLGLEESNTLGEYPHFVKCGLG